MRKFRWICVTVVGLVVLCVMGASGYLLHFSLQPDPNRHDTDSAYRVLYGQLPDMKPWIDSLRNHGLLRDTFVAMPTGEKHHALYLRADSAHGRTAIVVHGYQDCAVKFLYLARMYHRNLHYNVLLPDLHAHGLSEGDAIQMGWKDRLDVKHWVQVAEQLFRDSCCASRMVVHGVSMGAATTMCLAGEPDLPNYLVAFVEDCGYTSVWDEFRVQLAAQFSLPAFPLLYTASGLCGLKNGWTFSEASPVKAVAACQRPMLMIHGDADSFVPFAMLADLYEAKPKPKAMWVATGSAHARSYIDNPSQYTAEVTRFLANIR